MRTRTVLAILASSLLAGCASQQTSKFCMAERQSAIDIVQTLPDSDVKWIGTALSETSYLGDCPCPTDTAKDGSRCGERSAYSRSGGRGIACVADDIPDADVPIIRDRAILAAMPIECGGMGNRREILDFLKK